MADQSVPPGDARTDTSSRPEHATPPAEPPTQEIRAALVEAVCAGAHERFSDEAIAARREATDRLHHLVDAYVSRLRDRGVPPERAVGFMKTLIRATDIPCHRPLLTLESDITHWCIDAYYSERNEEEPGR
jgi:hypothetical protein